MPLYTLQKKDSDKTKTVMMSWEDLQTYLRKNPEWEQSLNRPAICAPTRVGAKKNSRAFKDRMDQIKKAHPKGNVEY